MRRFAVLPFAFVLALAAGCGKFSKPATWEEWLKDAPAAWQKQDFARAFDLCDHAFALAHQAANGPKAVLALECMAEAATQMGKPEMAFPAYETAMRAYDADMVTLGNALRLRNNFAVALVNAGRKHEGTAGFESALDAYEGTPAHSSANYRIRMLLVTNLARAARVFTDTDSGVRVSSEILREILNHLENERFRQNLPATLGTADALTAIAELVRLRGDPRYATELVAMAKEQRAIEDELLAGAQRRPQCEPVVVRALSFHSCYAQLQ